MVGEVREGEAGVVVGQRVPGYGRGEGGGGGQREGVGGGGPHPLLVDGGLVPGRQLLHPEAGVGRPVLRREGVERARPQSGHVGGRGGAEVVQERRQGAAAAALQYHTVRLSVVLYCILTIIKKIIILISYL